MDGIKVYSCPDGEIQRVQTVRLDSWEQLEFLRPEPSDSALECFADIYRRYLVPACPWLFGNMVLFRLPEDMAMELPLDTPYGHLADRLIAAAAALRRGVVVKCGKPVFRNDKARALWQALESRGCLRIVRGKLPVTQIIPVGNLCGYLTEAEPQARLKVNASFFIMDKFDCATVYDRIGTPLGLLVRDGVVENPPLFGREALLVKKDGGVSVEAVDIRNMGMEIDDSRYRHGENATVYSRPERSHTPPGKGTKLVIIGNRVAAVSEKPSVSIPASGFVLCPEGECSVQPGDSVRYLGLEDVRFGIQVGNSILRNGEKTLSFISRFYNIYKLQPVPFPPSLYPMDFHGARAARIALGADKEGKPMLLWAEGAAKLGHTPGADSRGATLADMAEFCADAGMVNAVNLDGGGSAQLLLDGCRSLQLSDRDPADGTEVQRPVPLALMVK